MSKTITVQAPSTIGNVGVGFDVLGCALDHIGDEIKLTLREDDKLIIQSINCITDLPKDVSKNAVTVPIQFFLKHIGSKQGFDVEINKYVPPGSGLGSSAASAVAGVFGANELLGQPIPKQDLLQFAKEGERIACGSPILDNITPSLLGGITIINKGGDEEIYKLPHLSELYVSIIYPPITIKTSEARELLKKDIPLTNAIKQWGSLATFISGVYEHDYHRIGIGLKDHIVEPVRAQLIPGFKEIKNAAINSGALGCSISGSGPSIFAMSKGIDQAHLVLNAMEKATTSFHSSFHSFVSGINKEGIKIIA